MKNQTEPYVITENDENRAWEQVNEVANDIMMSQDELKTLLEPLGFKDVDYEFSPQNDDNYNGIILHGKWHVNEVDMLGFQRMLGERENYQLFLGEGLTGFKPTIYHRDSCADGRLNNWANPLAALVNTEAFATTTANNETGIDDPRVIDLQGEGWTEEGDHRAEDGYTYNEVQRCEPLREWYCMVTDTIRKHNDARLHQEYEHHLELIREQKQEQLDHGGAIDEFMGLLMDGPMAEVASARNDGSQWLKDLIKRKDLIRRMLIERGVETLADNMLSVFYDPTDDEDEDASDGDDETPTE